ncbi:ABC transporter permease [Actinomadura sp. 9N407]|uniref:ABC transporter permease n=1 Tax=Actinomadura sp. 9N407 TaxID=3375154 RepID=UPI00379BE5FD
MSGGTAATGETLLGRGRSLASATTLMPLSGLALILVIAAIVTPGFYSDANMRLVLFQAGLIGITAVGQTLVLLGRGIDLSVGAVMGLTTVIIATQSEGDAGRLPVAIGLAALAGLLVGAVNAGLVVLRGVPPFVATFAVFVLVQGAITAWTKGAAAGDIPKALQPLGSGRFLGLPTPLWLFVVIAIVAAVILARTSAGRRLYATGSNPRAARLSGIRTGRVLAVGYIASALLAVLAGLVSAAYAGHVDAQLSRSLDLNSLAAAVIGGIALTGGRGHIGHTVIGVALLAVLIVWMIQLGAGAGGQLAVQGAAILLATWLRQRGTADSGGAK